MTEKTFWIHVDSSRNKELMNFCSRGGQKAELRRQSLRNIFCRRIGGGAWFFLHFQLAIVADISVRAGKILGYERFLPEFPQTCPESFRATLYANISPHKNHEHPFLDDLWKRPSCDFPQVGRQFFKIEQDWAPFLPVFSSSLPRVAGILWKFS